MSDTTNPLDNDAAWFEWRSKFPDAPSYEIFISAFNIGVEAARSERVPSKIDIVDRVHAEYDDIVVDGIRFCGNCGAAR